jgi:NADPH:quinone reductase-like Zn-dependent oxidoreductase
MILFYQEREKRPMATMKAIRIYGFGGPEVLRHEDVPRPEPGAGQILVRIHAAGVNAIDWKLRAGAMRAIYNPPLPLTPGCDLAGTIEGVGAGVDGFQPGDPVYGMPQAEIGTYAEFLVLNADDVAPKPQSLDFVAAASLPTAALTAWQSLFDVGGLTAGQAVLVHGAAGGVGSMAVQLAKAKGARVVGTASTDKVDFVQDLGADQVIDYTKTPFESVAKDIALVLDVIAGDTQARSWQTLQDGGVLVSTNPPAPVPPAEAAARGVQGKGVAVAPSRAQLEEIARLIDAGEVKSRVDTVLPLSQARQAHELGEAGKVRGKMVLKVR